MKKALLILLVTAVSVLTATAEKTVVASPDGRLSVTVLDSLGRLYYTVSYEGICVLKPSILGLNTSIGDFTQGLTFKGSKPSTMESDYSMKNIKFSQVHFKANCAAITYNNAKGRPMTVTFCVADNDIAFRYSLQPLPKNERLTAVVYSEATSFMPADGTTTFLSPQSKPMVGWQRTKPSYEEEYKAGAAMSDRSAFGEGYTFPCLFKIGGSSEQKTADAWMLISETGVDGNYVASHLSDYSEAAGYTITFPNEAEMQGMGSKWAAMSLPADTPWRTITVGTSLKPIVETTVAYDVVTPRYEATEDYKAGRYTWSWLIWQDNSVNYDDQVKMIDTASEMGYEYVLVDGCWDTQIGRDKMETLAAYAKQKNVRLLLWYNSNGYWNDAPQTPHDCMNTALARNREMKWLKSIGVAGIKVDFFGSDKQPMMQLYEDILTDANRYGLQVIFHGCTLPRGWERMYPNFVASEAALASENVYFTEHHAKQEGFELCMHPFCRNTVAAFDWGGIMMNRHMSRDNKSRHRRWTTDTFEMASGIVLQTSVNCVAIYPNNLLPAADGGMLDFQKDFLKKLPTTWDEVQFIDGYPTEYVVLARRADNRWYVAGLNGTNSAKTLTLSLPMMAGQTVNVYSDEVAKKGDSDSTPVIKPVKIGKKGTLKVTLQPMGGLIITE